MTEKTEIKGNMPEGADSSGAPSAFKSSDSADHLSDMIKTLEAEKVPAGVIQSFKKMLKNMERALRKIEVQAESIAKERALRMNAESELSSLRVKLNLMELEIQGYQAAAAREEEERYEDVEGAGEW